MVYVAYSSSSSSSSNLAWIMWLICQVRTAMYEHVMRMEETRGFSGQCVLVVKSKHGQLGSGAYNLTTIPKMSRFVSA